MLTKPQVEQAAGRLVSVMEEVSKRIELDSSFDGESLKCAGEFLLNTANALHQLLYASFQCEARNLELEERRLELEKKAKGGKKSQKNKK